MLVGIDTGGTYTDAVLYDDAAGAIVATAKALTRSDLTLGIRESLSAALRNVEPRQIEMVSVSTTLATNALVEGAGARAALIFIGFDDEDINHAGLTQALDGSPVIRVDGGHESLGTERAPLAVDDLVAQATGLSETVDAFAITSRFSVRNPEHELAAAAALAPLGKPVACGHQLTAKLNGPRRALTCFLNAKLIGLIGELCAATEKIMAELSITAPLMMVRGDGSLVAASVVRDRPIETILSGPAASLIGAAHLLAASGAVSRTDSRTGLPTELAVSDIGGTTTDVGVLRNGHPMVASAGAIVGGHQTMVEAVEMFTHGLGGDSEVALDTTVEPATVTLGPRRIVPVSMAALDAPDVILRALNATDWPFRLFDTRFVRATGRQGPVTSLRAEQLLERMTSSWRPYAAVVTSGLQTSTLRGLVAQGMAEMAGFTPTDAATVLELHGAGNPAVAAKAAEIMANLSDLRGEPVQPDGPAFARWVVDRVVRRSADVVLAAALARDGLDPGLAEQTIAKLALDRRAALDTLDPLSTAGPMVRIGLGLGVPVVGLGASASTYYPAVGHLLDATCIVPEHAGVANAVGAAVGQVRVVRQATISQPSKGQYRIHLPGIDDRGDLQPAIDDALAALRSAVEQAAVAAGAASIVLEDDVQTKAATIEGREFFVEATVTVIGVGPPTSGQR